MTVMRRRLGFDAAVFPRRGNDFFDDFGMHLPPVFRLPREIVLARRKCAPCAC
jgi:hypothetical protein